MYQQKIYLFAYLFFLFWLLLFLYTKSVLDGVIKMKDYDEYDEQILSFDNLLKDLCAEGFKSEDSRKHFMDNSSNIAKMLGIKDEE